MRYCLQFSYFGKNYFGYQIQPNQISVQEELEKALSTLLRTKTQIVAAGRTDTGVHARKIFGHFDTETDLTAGFVRQLNGFLPPDIAVQKLFRTAPDFHARFDATARTYHYFISTEKNVFGNDLSWQFWKRPLEVTAMNAAAAILKEYEDFAAFAKVGGDNKTTLCEIFSAEWQWEQPALLRFEVSANRFLRNMVRALVGTLVDVGIGKLSPEDFRQVIEGRNRGKAGGSAPAQGLFLVDVQYPAALQEIID